MRQYIIPHNYKDNGRIFNMFQPKAFIQAVLIFIPLSFLIMKLPFSINVRLFCVVLFVFPPAFAVLFGYIDWLGWLMHHTLTKRIYIYGGEHLDTAFPNTYTATANTGSTNRRK